MRKPFLLAAALSATAVGCSPEPMAGRPSSRQAARDFAVSQIALYNEFGIDPVQAGPRTLALMVALCGTASAVAGALEPEAPRTVQGFCSVVAKAAAPAA